MNSFERVFAISVAAATLTLTGCAVAEQATYTPPTISGEPIEYSTIVPRNFDETWSALVDYAAGAFFSIENFEKASGLMTLNFGASNPSAFVDCGVWSGNARYLDYIIQRYGANFSGKMNVLVKEQGPKTSLVRVNARYIVIVPPTDTSGADTYSFDSGGQARVAVGDRAMGTPSIRVCQPTHKAEKDILDAVKRLAAVS